MKYFRFLSVTFILVLFVSGCTAHEGQDQQFRYHAWDVPSNNGDLREHTAHIMMSHEFSKDLERLYDANGGSSVATLRQIREIQSDWSTTVLFETSDRWDWVNATVGFGGPQGNTLWQVLHPGQVYNRATRDLTAAQLHNAIREFKQKRIEFEAGNSNDFPFIAIQQSCQEQGRTPRFCVVNDASLRLINRTTPQGNPLGKGLLLDWLRRQK